MNRPLENVIRRLEHRQRRVVLLLRMKDIDVVIWVECTRTRAVVDCINPISGTPAISGIFIPYE
jgi:hypothetical protein